MKSYNYYLLFFTLCLLLSSCKPLPISTSQVHNADLEINGVSISATKPSDIWPPRHGKYFALDCGGTTIRKIVDGIETRVIEIRGWLTHVDNSANGAIDGDWRDWSYTLLPDFTWCRANGIDISKLLRTGNIIFSPLDPAICPGYVYSPYAVVSVPNIKVEVNGWVDGSPPLNPAFTVIPADYTFNNLSTSDTHFPFDPANPLKFQDSLKEGQYVRMVGSIVTDEPHDAEAGFPLFFYRTFGVNFGYGAQLNDSKQIWAQPYGDHDEPNPARYTEMHPPDMVSVLTNNYYKPQTEQLVGVALCEGQAFGNAGRSLDVDILPVGPRPIGKHAEVEEIMGSETNFNTITEGHQDANGSFTGATITHFIDKIHLHIRVQATPSNNGKFKALYRVFWQ